MVSAASALTTLRRAIQNADCEGAELGPRLDAESIDWLGQRLGFQLPAEYVQFLSAHDGAALADPVYFSLLESVRILTIYRRQWADERCYWPVGGDGCGNYFCIDLRPLSSTSGQVVFFETSESDVEPWGSVAESFPDFVVDQVEKSE